MFGLAFSWANAGFNIKLRTTNATNLYILDILVPTFMLDVRFEYIADVFTHQTENPALGRL